MTRLAELFSQPKAEPAKFDSSVLEGSRTLIFDIETIPATVNTYQLRTSFIPHKHVVTPGDMLCWAAGWYHEPRTVHFMDRQHHGYQDMLEGLWTLLDEASYVVGWNSDRFDLAKVRGYFARAGMPPFRPPRSIDLMMTARTMGFESSSLDYTARMLGVRRKVDNGGAANWEACMAGDEKAWKLMRTYNVGDVRVTRDLLDRMRPWIKGHPHMGLAVDDGRNRCPRCGSLEVIEVGESQAIVRRYQMYRCTNCTGLYRGNKAIASAVGTGV